MGRSEGQPPPVPLIPLLFLVLGAFGAIAGILQSTLFLYWSLLCFVLAYISYTHRKALRDLQSRLPEAPTRLLLPFAVLAIVSGLVFWSIRFREVVGDGHFVRVIHPFSSQAIGLVLLGLIAIVIALAARRPELPSNV